MAHRSSFRSSSEILELEEEELNALEHYKGIHHPKSDLRRDGKDWRSLNSNLGRVSSLEDDLNQLFGIFNRHNSSQGMVHSPRNGVPSKNNFSKKPVRASSSSANDLEASERSSLKKAFRSLCISQASQLASVKRSAKSGGSSKAGQVMTLYKNASVEDSSPVASQYEDREGLLEISFIPEEPSASSNGATASSKLTERVIESYESRSEMPKLEALSPERIPLAVFSPNARDSIVNVRQDTLIPTEPEGPSSLAETSRDEMLYSFSVSSSPIPDDNLLRTTKVSPIDTPMFSASSECPSRDSLTEMTLRYEHGPLPSASRSSDAKNNGETGKPMVTRVETVPASPDRISGTREPANICPTPYKPLNKGSAAKSTKLEDKASASKGGRKGDLQTVPSAGLAKGNHVKKPTKSVSRLVKPVIKTKNFVKRKSKKDASSAHSTKDTRSEFNNVLYPGSNHIVCPRCNCVLNDEWEEVEEDSPLSPGANPGAELSPLSPVMRASAELSPLSAVISPCAEMSLDNVFSDISTPTYNPNIANKSKEAVAERGDLKSRDTEEFTRSSKDSPDECRSSTTISQESSLGRLSSWDRPHMSKDVRWKAIRQVRMQHGIVSLKHFNLLKKLGCGDIGTVYLAELIDTNCLFAIKVMDNEFLARRKKIGRAQTEREILRKLDHPFLPTLYSQFTSDNLSCLVMEYCPGGDLHVLRQMQPGRCFIEQATRFYVAEVLLALEYLHMLGVIYRDLKPENILVREDGHIMLSDFDLSLRCAVNPTLLVSPSSSDYSKSMSGPFKHSSCVEPFCVRKPSCQVSCFGPRILRRPNKPQKLKHEPTDLLRLLPQLIAEPTDARSNSFVGTHEYLAPEIIKGEGHGSAVDWWTLGIFLYELLYGRTPFRGSSNEETLANVVLHNLKFPDSPPVNLQAKDLIAGLLVKDPESRLGSERGAAEVKQHPFFEGLNWALIRCAVPPELPELQRINGVGKGSLNEKLNSGININNNKYLEYNASSADHLEFEVF